MDRLKDFKSDEELNSYMINVETKIKNGESLTKEESDNFCFGLRYPDKKRFSFCDNDRFEYLYLHKRDNGESRPLLTSSQEIDFIELINEWRDFLESNSEADNKCKSIREEYKYELGNLKKNFRNIEKTSVVEKDFENKEREIVAYNRYIYLKGLDIFPEYRLPLVMQLDNKPIVIDEFILFHSLSRHYGQIIKQTNVVKSYFTEDVLVEDIYNLIIDLIDNIHKAKIEIENFKSIRFIYKSKYYQLYIKILKDNNRLTYRLNSFFPIEDNSMIQEIKSDYSEIKLNDNFIYLNKN